MTALTRWTVGLFGFVFHVAAAAVLGAKAARAPGGDPRALFGPAAAAALAAFVVYALVVTPYARKRFGSARKGVVLYDFLVGMLAEVAVVALAAVLFGLGTGGGAAASGAAGYLFGALQAAALGFLWAIGTALTEILVLGNAAGFLGFIVLKRLAARSEPSAHP